MFSRGDGTARERARLGVAFADLLITILIIGILAATAMPKFSDSLHRARAKAAATRIKADLKLARSTAVAQSVSQAVAFKPDSNAYSIAGVADINRRGGAYDVKLESEYGAGLISAALGGDTTVIFDRFGKPDNGGVITVESGGQQNTVTIDAVTGGASIP